MLSSIRRKNIKRINLFDFRKNTIWRRYKKKPSIKSKRLARRRKLVSKLRYKKASIFLSFNKGRLQRGESFLFFYRSFVKEKGFLNPRTKKDIVEILKRYLDIFSLSTLLFIYNPAALKSLKGNAIDPQINSFIELIELRLLPFFNLHFYSTVIFKRTLSTFSKKVQKAFLFVLKYVKKILKIQKITELYEKGYVGERDFVKLLGEVKKKVGRKKKKYISFIGSTDEKKKTRIKRIKVKLKRTKIPKLLKLKSMKKKLKKKKGVKRLKIKRRRKGTKKPKLVKLKKKKKISIAKIYPLEKKDFDRNNFKKATVLVRIHKFLKILKKTRFIKIKKIKSTLKILMFFITKLNLINIKIKKKKEHIDINNILRSKNIGLILKRFNVNLKSNDILITDRLSFIEMAIKIFKIFSRYNLEEKQNLNKRNIMSLNHKRRVKSFVNIFLLPWAQIRKRERRTRIRKTNLTTRQRFSQKYGLSMYKLWRLSRKTRRKHRGGLYLDFLSYFELGISKFLRQSNFIMTEKEALYKIKEGGICINGKITREPKHRVRPFDIVSFQNELRRTERSNFLLRLLKGDLTHSLWGFFEYNFRLYCFMFLPLYLKYQHKLTSAYLTHLNKGRFFIEKR